MQKKIERPDIQQIWRNSKGNILVILCIIVALRVAKPVNVFGFVSIILVIITSYKLYRYVVTDTKPEIKKLVKSLLITVITATTIYYLYHWLGGYGLIGFLVLVLLFAAWRIYKGWALFKQTSLWIRETVRGGDDEKSDLEEKGKSESS